ncbi:hypothetical protein AR457_06620 [Streptomyces agglomeratus]|uniref:Uncharacterized protein n=1 Tax=Streptomyces agglomeratus TaxID=285458 RepID=A0A1E5P4C9_9ACTN|nr:hypothetical protein [Streptomyces agglomeratus]OEJ24194.1 hypothetical protein AS594_06545 [Streptomyces agglomeratus]OEJ41800.1 hypothetical protein BGK70_30025 [Streptomyces agglomeratus]OEJ43822.1 hypothetical protein AR457_06620 [Streptomyces agglomeratus]OEJ54292.1 hypothetical protein BGK72_29345 [Streptomyces agglomeratus]OEJ61661.1 hypothetical protein BGM19_30250 [Streptomyces agglomeratus]
MSQESRIVDVAETILNGLTELTEESEGQALAGPLAALTERARTETDPEARLKIEDDLVELLASSPATRERLDELLPEIDGEKSAESPYTLGRPVAKDRWVCPEGGYAWAVLSADDPEVPPSHCPVHTHLRLVFRPATSSD